MNGVENGHNGRVTKHHKNGDGKQIVTTLKSVPITVERPPFVPSPQEFVKDFGTARANLAITRENPNGIADAPLVDWHENHKNQTTLQQHCTYFDPDGDGIIWPQDTFWAIRAWGWNLLLCTIATAIIHGGLSYFTCPSILPDPFFRIYNNTINKAKHGSDSGTYDNEGRYKAQQFEDIFSKYDKDQKGGLTVSEIRAYLSGQRVMMDPFGWSAAILEWTATYLLLWPEDGVIKKEDVRGIYDGSTFQRKADEHKAKIEGKKA